MSDGFGNISIFWAKSNAGGQAHSLVGHLLDAAAVAELMWDHFLARNVCDHLDRASSGRGRDLLVMLAAMHDLGKATPAFQMKAADRSDLVGPLRQAGLSLPSRVLESFKKWPHPRGSVEIARELLASFGVVGAEWVLPLLEGHHGQYGAKPKVRDAKLAHTGDGWPEAQQELARVVLARAGIDLRAWELSVPSRGVQLALGGLVVMADWIASSDFFPGCGLVDLSMTEARKRAESAWAELGLVRGWREDRLIRSSDAFQDRFGFRPRAVQSMLLETVGEMTAPGILILEAPMGEGKTEAALAAAEMIGAATGCSGVVFAMPTQGTTDAMYARVSKWMEAVDPEVPVSLLHGKAMLNEDWVAKLEGHGVSGVFDQDDFGMCTGADPYGLTSVMQTAPRPASWVLGRHRGLLSPVAVATVDQVLWAATRTRFVALRHAGMAGRVLIIDEVHSYDAYMAVFLHELLRWCARMGVPIVLMSATLAPRVRRELVEAWRQGAGLAVAETPEPAGYPSVMVWDQSGRELSEACSPHNGDRLVTVDVLSTTAVADVDAVAQAVIESIEPGGCALVICNTVARAQAIARHLAEAGIERLLIHGRLTAAERARRTDKALEHFGAEGARPHRLALVATQIAEQSFDVDADILFTDIAPMDLLLQRAGRLHRHSRPEAQRPEALRRPRLVVTGLMLRDQRPSWPDAFDYVYRPGPLLASAAEVLSTPRWSLPSEIPRLVARAYADDWSGPEEWAAEVSRARDLEEQESSLRQHHAETFRLDADPATERTTLEKLHYQQFKANEDEDVVVRDGDDTLEVSLIVSSENGLRTLGGTPLGRQGERAADVRIAREILGDSVRLRWRPGMEAVTPRSEWVTSPFLHAMPVIELNEELIGSLGGWSFRYDLEEGLVTLET